MEERGHGTIETTLVRTTQTFVTIKIGLAGRFQISSVNLMSKQHWRVAPNAVLQSRILLGPAETSQRRPGVLLWMLAIRGRL